MSTIDLEPAARRLGDLLAGVTDDQLGAPTPCPEYCLADLLEHIGGLAVAFTAAATKDVGDGAAGQAPAGDASRLPDDWRTRIPQDLVAMAGAWRDPDAWTGMTAAGGVELPGEVAGLVALDELVIHGWDVARSIGRPYEAEDDELGAIQQFVAPMADAPAEERAGLFGPPVPVPDDAPLLDRVLGMTGRDPAWTAG